MRFDDILEAIGHTPLVRLRGPGEAYAKLELQNLFAMKDRVAKQVLLDARRTGALADGAPVIESSSGTMALGLALVGRALGHPVHIVTDPRIDPITRSKLAALGCDVHVVEAMTSQGWQSARLERLATLMSTLEGAFWPRQYSNPQNPFAYAALAAELRADLGRVDVLVGSVGSGGSLCGTARALRAALPDLRVVAVDAVGSVLFAQPDRPGRRQSGLGNSLHPENLDHSLIDEVHWLNDDEAFEAAQALAREQQIFGGNTSGSVYRVVRHLAATTPPGTRIVGILPDRGDRYVDTVYRDPVPAGSAAPRRVPYGDEVSSWSYAVLADRPFLLFVESNTTGTGMLALRTAARLGLAPVFLTSKPDRYAGLTDTPARTVDCETNDPAALREAVAGLGGRLAGVATTSEFYLTSVAELAESLGLPGNAPGAVAACRDKSRTRAVLAEAGVRQPRFAVVTRPADVPAAARMIGLPCVAKPAEDSGSANVLLCSTVDELAAHVERVLAVDTNVRGQPAVRTVLVEEYLPHPEYSVELFSVAGAATCVGITEKAVTGLPYFIECGHVFPAELPPDVATEMADTAVRALTATGFAYGAHHLEVKLTPAGAAVVEINARLAGGMIPELIRLATGADLLEQQVRAFAGLPVTPMVDHRRYAGIRFLLAGTTGVLDRFTGVDEARRLPGVDRVVLTATPGDAVFRPRNAYDRLGYVIAVGDTAVAVRDTLDRSADRISLVIREGDS
jgi:S-sulfo-L-cysteine synthase (3-phospho-L-serine-dependent)